MLRINVRAALVSLIVATVFWMMLVGRMQVANAGSIGADKYQHVSASCAIELALAETPPFKKWKPWQRMLLNVVVVGGAKEWYDHKHPGSHTAEWADIGADAIGAATGEGVLWLVHKTW